MSLQRPDDFQRVVLANAKKTRGFILAQSHPCLDVRDREVEVIRRDLEPGCFEDLSSLRLPHSWILAIILCPGDTTNAIAKWATKLPAANRDRIRFYLHQATDPILAFSAWFDVDLPPPRADEVEDWREFHKLFGLHLNETTYRDAKAGLFG